MLDFVSKDIYIPLYQFCVLCFVISLFAKSLRGTLFDSNSIFSYSFIGRLFLIFLAIYIGLRPSYPIFTDMGNYANMYYLLEYYPSQIDSGSRGEIVFHWIMEFFATNHINVHLFFFFITSIFLLCYYLATKKLFGNKYFYALIGLFCMFNFIGQSTNVIRVSLALSIAFLAFSYRKNWLIYILLALIAVLIHKTALLIVGATIMTTFIKSSKIYFAIWLGCLSLSLALGDRCTDLMLSLGIGDERMESYLTGADELTDQFSSTGFRWDFVAFSLPPIVLGWYLIYRKKYLDVTYIQMLNIYLLSNAFWLLVIRAAFTDRFAALSWSFYPFVMLYPFIMNNVKINLKSRNQGYILSLAIIYFLTLYWNILLPLVTN